jgi:deazaflavin-dependent oxidoreductase (nitroreductase family)
MSWQQILNRIANPSMKWLLRSPLHWLVSKRVVLIEFRGRKSGKTYRTPVMYAPCDAGIVISTSRDYLWWRNLRGGVQVRLWLRGREHQGHADASESADDIARALRTIYPQASPAMRTTMTAHALVVVRVRLSDDDTK